MYKLRLVYESMSEGDSIPVKVGNQVEKVFYISRVKALSVIPYIGDFISYDVH